jgi:hypothetical protein
MEPIRGQIGVLVVRRLGRRMLRARQADLSGRGAGGGERAPAAKRKSAGACPPTPQPDRVRLARLAPRLPRFDHKG